jgi:hypothetical protein
MTPGLRAAALLAEDGRLVAGDAALGGAVVPANRDDLAVVRGASLVLVAQVDGRPLRGLLRADMKTAAAMAEAGRTA